MSAPKRIRARPAPKSADDFGPTVRQTWPDVAHTLLDKHISALPEGINVGAIVYPVAIAKLGYADDDAVKAALNVASLKDVDGTLAELMHAVIVASPVMTQEHSGQTAAEKHGIAAGQ